MTAALVFKITVDNDLSVSEPLEIRVPLGVPADDFPYNVKAQAEDPDSLRLIFHYAPSRERKPRQKFANSEITYGEKTGRIYEIVLRNFSDQKISHYNDLTEFASTLTPVVERTRFKKNLQMGDLIVNRLITSLAS